MPERWIAERNCQKDQGRSVTREWSLPRPSSLGAEAGGRGTIAAMRCRSPQIGFSAWVAAPAVLHGDVVADAAAGRRSSNVNGFALVTMLGLLGLRIFEATGANIEALEEVHGHRVLRVLGMGDKVALVPLPPAVGRAIERAVDGRLRGPILRSRTGSRMDRRCATRRLRALARTAGVSTARMHPHMLRHTLSPQCSTPGWTCATCRSPPGTLIRGPPCVTTALARIWTGTPTTCWRPTWPQEPKRSSLVNSMRHDRASVAALNAA